ncbi:MAG: UvrD-helicase domain-containing protein, partial [Planctomycetota bacterium]
MIATPEVAIARTFMESYSRLPRKVQKKVREFTEKFRLDPTSSGINFERIEGARDQKVRSVRIDQPYRAIVVHPPRGDVFLCVWVDHHQEAYDWARNKVFEVNPKSGVLQLYTVQEGSAQAETPAAPAKQVEKALFDAVDDEELVLAGVPAPLLASVRALKYEHELDALAPHLPADAADLLYLLASGYGLWDAVEELERSKQPPERVDVEDFKTAVALPESQSTFHVVGDERELEHMLDAPLDQWRVFLHPTQRKLVRMEAKGPARVLGGAGTGKTVVLMHRAHYLAHEKFLASTDRILVTTYTRNLALDLKANLKTLCGDSFARLEVTNLHHWASQFLAARGHKLRIATQSERRRLFDQAIEEFGGEEFVPAFYLEEWERVCQPQDVSTRDDYLTARRVGRGTRLSRKLRAEVWKVLARYRALLEEHDLHEYPDVIREARLFIEKNRVALPYRAVLADETQDFTPTELKLLRTLVPPGPNDLFLVGDGHQRIYGQPVRIGACGIDVRGRRGRRLKLNYRTTEQIRNHAVAILEGCEIDDLDGGLDSMKGYRSLRTGPTPEVSQFDTDAAESEFLVMKLKEWLAEVPAATICLAVRTHD